MTSHSDFHDGHVRPDISEEVAGVMMRAEHIEQDSQHNYKHEHKHELKSNEGLAASDPTAHFYLDAGLIFNHKANSCGDVRNLPTSSRRHRTRLPVCAYAGSILALVLALFVAACYLVLLVMLGSQEWPAIVLTGFIARLSITPVAPGVHVELVPYSFAPLPLGSVVPTGWLASQLQLMADGLAGHQHDFYRYVSQSPWLGGSEEYSGLSEAFPYWLNGIVPLAYGINDKRLQQVIRTSVQYVLHHQAGDGWLGPETIESKSRNLWGRYPLLLAFTQLLEADDSYTENVLPGIRRYIDLVHSMLKDGGAGFVSQPSDALSDEDHGWARIRVGDFLVTLQWLYEHDAAGGQQEILMDIMHMLRKNALDWADWYTEDRYIFGDTNYVDEEYLRQWFPYEHGVNIAQGLKAGAVVHRFERNTTMVDLARRAVDWSFKYHASASGSILADERLTGLLPYYGYLYQALGDKEFADRAELTAFNALPAAVTGDWWAHQYITQANQPYSKYLEGQLPFWNVNGRAPIYGVEPNYPCCVVNHPQGFPKFAANSWASVGRDGLAHVLLSPSKVRMRLDNGARVSIEVTTNYPFSDLLRYDIQTDMPMTLHVRVPAWSASTTWSLSTQLNVEMAGEAQPDERTGLMPVHLPSGHSSVSFTFQRSIRTIPRANDSIAIMHGPLVYALDVGHDTTWDRPKLFNDNNRYLTGPIPDAAKDYTILNTTAWNIAINVSTLVAKTRSASSDADFDSQVLASQAWSYGAPPTYLEAEGCEIDWPLYRGCPGIVPKNRTCLGPLRIVRFVPMGSAKIGMTELPTL